MDDFETQVARMMRERVTGMPAEHDAQPATLARARRRRLTKLGAFATAVAVVVVGTAAAVAQAGHDDSNRLTTAGPTSTTVPQTRPSVDTVQCPITSDIAASYVAPTTTPRLPEAGDRESLSGFTSFAAANDPTYVVLGPSDWSCLARFEQSGRSLVVTPVRHAGSAPLPADAPIAIENNLFDGYASTLACSVFFADLGNADIQNGVRCLNVFPRGRQVTRVDAQISTFVDPNGTRGAGRLIQPSNRGVADGSVSVLTCRPTDGLTSADCDTIVADWVARASTTTTTTPTAIPGTVPTTVCSVTYGVTPDMPLPAPRPLARPATVPLAGDLVSFAATTEERFVVLGPRGWSCATTVGADGNSSMVLHPPGQTAPAPFAGTASLSIDNDWLWHGMVGVGEACQVFSDSALVNQAKGNEPCALAAGRTVTRVDAHVSTFRDADGTRGAGRVDYPSSPTVDDGKISILTCRPTDGLTAAECDTIVADFVARLRDRPSTEAPTAVATAPDAISGWVATASGLAIADQHDAGISAYDAANNSWSKFEGPPFAGDRYIVAARGNSVFVAGTPAGSTAPSSPFASLDVTTGKWRSLAPVPGRTPYLTTVGDADHIFGVGAFEDNGESPAPMTVAVEYDVAADRWTRMPDSPLGGRRGSALQWTGSELLVWSGGNNHQGGVAAYTDGAAYNPATRTWRKLPESPSGGRVGAASVWTGSEMLVWGGEDCGGCGHPPVGTGAAYNPTTNEWRTLPDAALRGVVVPAAVWTGHEMVVMGGGQNGSVAVAAYDPTSNAWRSLLPPTPPEYQGNGAFAAFASGHAILGVTADGVLTAVEYAMGS